MFVPEKSVVCLRSYARAIKRSINNFVILIIFDVLYVHVQSYMYMILDRSPKNPVCNSGSYCMMIFFRDCLNLGVD